MKPSEELERQVERIHAALEKSDATITWNERVPDPDNPHQLRQIDVTIRRPGTFTIVECRLHREPQDVTWIEELHGRRQSLRADAIIAVSASGFTEGAVRKAARLGVILRTLRDLTAEEVGNWGREVLIVLRTYRFREFGFDIKLPSKPEGKPTLSQPDGKVLDIRPLFGMIMNRMTDDGVSPGAHEFVADIESAMLVSGIPADATTCTAKVECCERRLRVAAVLGYSRSGNLDPHSSVEAVVRRFDGSVVEVIDDTESLSITVDLSGAGLHTNEFVHSATFDFGEVRGVKWFDFVGTAGFAQYTSPIRLRLIWPNEPITTEEAS